MSNRKGDRRERELVRALTACGLAAMRCPASGSATDRDLPDVVASRPLDTPRETDAPAAEVWAIELKATAETTAYADAAEVDALRAFAYAAGGRPLVGARFDGDRCVYLVAPDDCRPTDGGNYGIPESDAADRARYVVDATAEEIREAADA